MELMKKQNQQKKKNTKKKLNNIKKKTWERQIGSQGGFENNSKNMLNCIAG